MTHFFTAIYRGPIYLDLLGNFFTDSTMGCTTMKKHHLGEYVCHFSTHRTCKSKFMTLSFHLMDPIVKNHANEPATILGFALFFRCVSENGSFPQSECSFFLFFWVRSLKNCQGSWKITCHDPWHPKTVLFMNSATFVGAKGVFFFGAWICGKPLASSYLKGTWWPETTVCDFFQGNLVSEW